MGKKEEVQVKVREEKGYRRIRGRVSRFRVEERNVRDKKERRSFRR